MTESQRAVPASLIPDDITPEAAERIRWTLIGYTMAVEERNRYRAAWMRARSYGVLLDHLDQQAADDEAMEWTR